MKFSAAKLLFGVFLLFSPLVFAQVENPIIQDAGEESTLIPIPEKINESRILPPPTTDITISNDIIVSGADAVWTPDLFSAPADVIDSTDGISFLPEAYVSGADTFWNSDLIVVSSDVLDSTDAPSQNLTEAFISHADTIWATGLIEQGEGEPPPPPPTPWLKVSNTPLGIWRLRQTPGTENKPENDVLKIVPNDWVLKLISKTDESGQTIDKDGYTWWRVENPGNGVLGWMAAQKSDGSEQYFIAGEQSKTEELTTKETRTNEILEAVDHYYRDTTSQSSLYSSNDNDNHLSLFKENGFPIELILAVAAHESGIIDFDNEWVSYDYGHGVMQITFSPTYGWDNRGIGSSLKIPPCSLENNNYKNCYGEPNVSMYGKREYIANSKYQNQIFKYYTNLSQDIYTNIKDGLRTLQGDYSDSLVKNATSSDVIKWAGTVWRYNHGFPRRVIEKGDEYLARIADKLESNPQKFEILEEYFADYKTKIPSNNFLDNTKRAELVNKFKGYKTGEIKSPGELRAYDSQGKVTGLINGEIRNEIPDSDYYNNSFIIYTPSDFYHYEVKGTEGGSYGLTLSSVVDGEINNFDATEIPTSANVFHQYTVDWDALSQGENGVTLRIDSDGDGIFEKTVTADKELTKEEFLLQMETVVDFDPDTLNLKSQGKVVTTYIELPRGFDVNKIDISSIKLNDLVPALSKPTSVGDYDADGTPDLMVKFDRNKVQSILTTGEKVPIIITGKVLHDSSYLDFKGNDTIRVIK